MYICLSLVVLMLITSSRWYPISLLQLLFFSLAYNKQSVGRHFKTMQISCFSLNSPLHLASIYNSCPIQSLQWQLQSEFLTPTFTSWPLHSSHLIHFRCTASAKLFLANSYLSFSPNCHKWCCTTPRGAIHSVAMPSVSCGSWFRWNFFSQAFPDSSSVHYVSLLFTLKALLANFYHTLVTLQIVLNL